jgi:hypothetical protein
MKKTLATLLLGMSIGVGMLSTASATPNGFNVCWSNFEWCLKNNPDAYPYCRQEYVDCKEF